MQKSIFKTSTFLLHRIFLLAFICFFFNSISFARGTDTDNDKKSKSTTKKDSTDSAKAPEYAFKSLFPTETYNPSQPYVSQLRPEAVAFVGEYIRTQGKELQGMKSWAMPYFRVMDGVLLSYGIPKEMKYLAVIESHLNMHELSHVGAYGPWQFMPETGRNMGLVVNGYMDERADYYKSTQAAAKYLKQLYAQLGDWLLVVAAYNGGPGRVLSAIRQTGSRDFWVLQNYLPLETRNHVKKFIGTHYAMEGTGGETTNTTSDWKSFQVKTIKQTTQIQASLPAEMVAGTDEQNIQGKYNSLIMAKNLTIDIAQFNKLNPNFDALVDGDKGYNLRLPKDKLDLFNANRYIILHECILTALQSPTSNLGQYPSDAKLKTKGKH